MKKIEKMQGCSTGELCDKVDELVDAVNLFFTPTFFEVKEEPRKEEINQCDGCRRGIPIKDGVHQGNSVWDLQACTKDKYEPTLADRLWQQGNPKVDWERVADEAKKAFEELINESVVLEILRNELISKIRRM